MKKKKKDLIFNISAIIIVLLLIYFLIIPKNVPETTEEITICIGENSLLYVQLGCSHCETQEEMFGENTKHLNKIDCFYEPERCEGIQGTPTWDIDGNLYSGVQEIDTLRELTGC